MTHEASHDREKYQIRPRKATHSKWDLREIIVLHIIMLEPLCGCPSRRFQRNYLFCSQLAQENKMRKLNFIGRFLFLLTTLSRTGSAKSRDENAIWCRLPFGEWRKWYTLSRGATGRRWGPSTCLNLLVLVSSECKCCVNSSNGCGLLTRAGLELPPIQQMLSFDCVVRPWIC